jgi:DNA-binding transcriptional regulator GbsR (MarR family)
MTSRASRPDAERRRTAFVEAFGEELTRSGMNRMAARAFAAIAASDGGQRTAADLSEELRASPAAISGAVRYLEQVDMIRRSRPLGSRRDVFSLTDDVWYEALTHRGSVVERWRDMMTTGAEQLGPDTPAGRRMSVMADFFAFMAQELPALMERWHEQYRRDPSA